MSQQAVGHHRIEEEEDADSDQAEVYYKAAQKADAKFFRRLNNEPNFEQAVRAAECFMNEQNLLSIHDSIVPLSGLEFTTSSRWRIHRLRDFTALAISSAVGIQQLNFSFEEGGRIKLEFNCRQNQPGNARLSYNDWNPLSYNDIFQQEFFKNLPGFIVSELIRKSRTSGRLITREDLQVILTECEQHQFLFSAGEEEMLHNYVIELNHFMLLLDFEIARHLQLAENQVSKDFNDLPIGVGIAILSSINRSKDKDMIRGLFCKDPQNRKETLKRLIKMFLAECDLLQHVRGVDGAFLALEKEFYSLLSREFSSH